MEQTKPASTDKPSPDDLDSVQEQMRSQEDAERKARIEYLRSIAGPRKPKRTWLKVLLAIGLLVLLGAGAVYWFVLPSPAPKPAGNQADSSQKAGSAATGETDNVPTKHYDSANFTLGFDYPENWTVKDESKLTIVSPAMPLKAAGGGTTQGQIAIIIQSKQTTLDAFKKGNAVAARDSEKISYSKPTQNQRAQTYLSFLTYAGSTTTGIDGIYITGDIGYQKDQAAPLVDVVRSDPLVTVAFWKCNGSNCTEGATFALSADSWNDSSAPGKPVKAILASLSIQ